MSRDDGLPNSDRELIERALDAANGDRFRMRFEHSYDEDVLREAYDTRRQAEVALLANLAFWTGQDPEQMWRIFRASAQYRPVVDDVPEYRDRLLREALSLVSESYDWRAN